MMRRLGIGVIMLIASHTTSAAVLLDGTFLKWQPLVLDVNEPGLVTNELAVSPNPFLDIALNVEFNGPSGQQYVVPGFFAGDGNGGSTGSVWRVRFSPDEAGDWQYRISFRQGDEIAIQNDLSVGAALPDDDATGSFTIAAVPPSAQGFEALGRLEYVGKHYLKFADGPYWIKGGVDSPENFFGFAGFDNTIDHVGGVDSTGLNFGLHEYAPHVDDWVPGDPDFSNVATGHSGRGIIGAINYLASEGVNSIYFLPMNLGGDGRETFPFVGTSGSRFDNTHFDVSKLAQWNQVLQHMQRKGIAAHVVLAETEVGNRTWLDDGELGVERKLFYRELVARFSYLLALKWNISEESRYGTERHREFAAWLRQLDWADHQIGVHTNRDRAEERYDDLVGDVLFDVTSIQFSPELADQHTETWRTRSAETGWPWVVDMDEVGPPGEGLTDSNVEQLRRSVLYPVLFSGGNIEWYFGYHALPLGGDIRTEDFRTREPMYRYMRIARELMQNEMPFQDMQPMDDLHSLGADSNIQVFAVPGEIYALYLPEGNVGGSLFLLEGDYSMRWFDPRNGGFKGESATTVGGEITVGNPPEQTSEDWILLIQRDEDITDGNNDENPVTDVEQNNGTGDAETDRDSDTEQDTGASGSDQPALGAAVADKISAGGTAGLLFVLIGLAGLGRRNYRYR